MREIRLRVHCYGEGDRYPSPPLTHLCRARLSAIDRYQLSEIKRLRRSGNFVTAARAHVPRNDDRFRRCLPAKVKRARGAAFFEPGKASVLSRLTYLNSPCLLLRLLTPPRAARRHKRMRAGTSTRWSKELPWKKDEDTGEGNSIYLR